MLHTEIVNYVNLLHAEMIVNSYKTTYCVY